MLRHTRRTDVPLIVAALVGAVVMFSATFALGANLAHADGARRVALTDAVQSPPFLARIQPGRSVDIIDPQCGSRGAFFTETQAYRHDGSALGAQQWTRDRTVTYWRGAHGRVTFDGVTFRNGTRAPVLVGGWCG